MKSRGDLQQFLLNPNAAVTRLLHACEDAAQHLIPFAVGAVALAVLALLLRGALRRARRRRMEEGARYVEISVPPEVDRAGAVMLWSMLVGLLRPFWRRLIFGQPHLTFEYAWTGTSARIGMWVPGDIPPGIVEGAVEGAWPGSKTTTVEATPPVSLRGQATGGVLRLHEREWFPLRSNHDADPLRALFGAARDLADNQHAAVQILARPLTGRRVRRAFKAAKAMRQGRPTTAGGRLLDFVLPGPSRRARPADDPALAPDLRIILDKASHQTWEAQVRYVVATDDEDARAAEALRGRAHAIASAFATYTGRNGLHRRRLRRPAEAVSQRRLRRGDLLSVPELAALAHLPLDATVPGLTRAGAKVVSPPPDVQSTGKVLGVSEIGGRRPIALAVDDARYHLHVMGGTGSGKSTLLTNLVLGDVDAGRGAVVIDPAGDLVNDILDRLPARAASRVVLLDPEARGNPPSLNVLQGADRDLLVDNVVGIFHRIYEAFWGPRTDDVLRSACHTALLRPGATLASVPAILADPKIRAPYIADLDDPVGLGGFWSWYEGMSPAMQAQVIGPVMNKLRAFFLRPFVRRVLGTSQSTFDMRWVLDGALCLVRIPKGVLGEETSRLLGSFVVAQVWQVAAERARLPQQLRKPASLVVDECQNFLNLPRSFDDMLAEARKYNLSLGLAHQNLSQLPPKLRDALSANARNKIFFVSSPEDAHALVRHVEPELSEHDLANLGTYQAAARLVVRGGERPAFTMTTLPARAAMRGRAAMLRRRSAERFGAKREPKQPSSAASSALRQALGQHSLQPRPPAYPFTPPTTRENHVNDNATDADRRRAA